MYLADGNNLHREGVLVVVGGILLIVADQLLISTVPHWYNTLKEIQEPLAMTAFAEKEVNALQTQRTMSCQEILL